MSPSLPPEIAWEPLPAREWDADAARHLLRRAGWTARSSEVERALAEGLSATLDRLFPPEPPLLRKPRLMTRFEQDASRLQTELRTMAGDSRLRAQRELQDRARAGVQELSIKWLDYAAHPEASAIAKWGLFLSDVYVISAEKVRNPVAIFRHFEILAQQGLGAAPELTKAISRSPGMSSTSTSSRAS